MNSLIDLMEVRLPAFLKPVRFGLIQNQAIDTAKGLIWLQEKISSNQISPSFQVISYATIQFIPKHPTHCVRPENSPLIFYLTPSRNVPPGDFQVSRLPCLFVQVSVVNPTTVKVDFLFLGSSLYDTQSMARTLVYALSPKNRHAILTKLKSQVLNTTPLASGKFRDDVCYTRTTAQLELVSQVVPDEMESPLLFFGKKKQLLVGKNIKLPELRVIQGQLDLLSVPSFQLESPVPALIPLLAAGSIRPVLEGINLILDRPIRVQPSASGLLTRVDATPITAPTPVRLELGGVGALNRIETTQLRNRRNPILAQPFRVRSGGFIGSRAVTNIVASRTAYLSLPYAVWQIIAIPVREIPLSTASLDIRNTFPLTDGRQITVNGRILTVFTVKSDWGHLRFQIVSVAQIEPPYSQRFNYQTCKFPPDYYQIILPEVVEDNIYQATIYEQQFMG